MKQCQKCGQGIKDDSKFCPFCGSQQIQTSKKEESDVNQQQEESKQRDVHYSENLKQEPKSDQFKPYKKKAKDYFAFLNQNVKRPQMLSCENNYNGLINIILTSLFIALAVSNCIYKSMNSVVSGISSLISSASYNQMNAFPGFFSLFITIAGILFFQVLILFVFQRNIAKEKISFLGSCNSLFVPISLTVYLALGSFVFSFISGRGILISLLLILLIFTFVGVNFSGQLWIHSENLHQRFYLVLITIVVKFFLVIIVMQLFGDLFKSQLDLDNMMRYMF